MAGRSAVPPGRRARATGRVTDVALLSTGEVVLTVVAGASAREVRPGRAVTLEWG